MKNIYLNGSQKAIHAYLQELGIYPTQENSHHFTSKLVNSHIYHIDHDIRYDFWCKASAATDNNPIVTIHFGENVPSDSSIRINAQTTMSKQIDLWNQIRSRFNLPLMEPEVTMRSLESAQDFNLASVKQETTIQSLEPAQSVQQGISELASENNHVEQTAPVIPSKMENDAEIQHEKTEKKPSNMFKTRDEFLESYKILNPNTLFGKLKLKLSNLDASQKNLIGSGTEMVGPEFNSTLKSI